MNLGPYHGFLQGVSGRPLQAQLLAQVEPGWVSCKAVLLLSTTPVRRVGEWHVLPVSGSSLRINSDAQGVPLWVEHSVPSWRPHSHLNQPVRPAPLNLPPAGGRISRNCVPSLGPTVYNLGI